MRPAALSLRGLALLGVLAAALAFTGCGRKGPLEAPPGAAIDRPPVTAAPDRLPDEQVPITPNSKKRSPLDWLID